MKLKKLILELALGSAIAALTSCNLFVKTPPTVEKLIAYDADGQEISFENGDTSVDPSMKYLYIQFDKDMDTDHWGYSWENGYDSNTYVINRGFIDSHTFCLVLNLSYSANLLFDFNDPSALSEDFTRDSSWFKSTDGAYLDKYTIKFSTKDSPNANTPMTYEYNLNDEIYQNWPVTLEYNEYGNPPNLQTGISIKELFEPEVLKKGDVIKIKYQIYANENLPEIVVNLVDVSSIVSYWNPLAKETDIPLTKTKYIAGTKRNPNYYDGEFVFTVDKAMTSTCTLQFTCMEYDDPENQTVQFIIPTNN